MHNGTHAGKSAVCGCLQEQRAKAKAEGTQKRRTKRTPEQKEVAKKFLQGMVADSEYQVRPAFHAARTTAAQLPRQGSISLVLPLLEPGVTPLLAVQGQDYEVFSTWLGSTQAA